MERTHQRRKIQAGKVQAGQVLVEVTFVVTIIAFMLVAMLKFHKGKVQTIEKDMQIKKMKNYKTKSSYDKNF